MLPQSGECGDLPHAGEVTRHRPGTPQVLHLVHDDAAVGIPQQPSAMPGVEIDGFPQACSQPAPDRGPPLARGQPAAQPCPVAASPFHPDRVDRAQLAGPAQEGGWPLERLGPPATSANAARSLADSPSASASRPSVRGYGE